MVIIRSSSPPPSPTRIYLGDGVMCRPGEARTFAQKIVEACNRRCITEIISTHPHSDPTSAETFRCLAKGYFGSIEDRIESKSLLMQMDIARIPSLRNHAQAIAEGDAVAIQTLRTQVDNAPITALFDSLCISHQQGSLILAMEELSNDDIQPLIEEARTNIFLRHGANPRNLANYVAQGISWTHPRNDRNVAIALEYTISQIPPEQLREDQNEGDYQVLLRVASTPRDGIEALTTHIEQLSDQDFQAVLRQCAVELLVWGEVQRSDAKNCVGITLALANEGGRLELKKLIEQPYRDPNVMLIG